MTTSTAGKPLDLAQFEGHTPGPWSVDVRSGMAAAHYGQHVRSHVHSRDGCISGADSLAEVKGDAPLKNAALIAAAPALLAECHRLRARNAELVGTLCSISATSAHTSGRFTDHPAKNALDAITHTARAALGRQE